MTIIVIHPGAEKPFLGNGRWHVEYPEAHHFNGIAKARKTAQDILQATTSDEIKYLEVWRNYGYENEEMEEVRRKTPKKNIVPYSGKVAHNLYFLNAIKALGFHPFIDGKAMCVSAEHDDLAADYYEEFIHPALKEWAEAHKLYWDWQNPGAIVLSD